MATTPEDFDRPAAGRELAPAQIALAVLGVILVLALVWFVFVGGDDEATDTATPVTPAPVTTPADDEDEVAPPGGRRPVETFEVFAPKDPFDPLISAAAAGDTTGETTTTDGTTETTDGATMTTDGTTTTNGTGTTTTTTTGGNGNRGEDVGGHRVRVIDVFRDGGRDRAQVQVDGTVYTVDEGERFAQNFQLLSTSGQCATMLFGDDEFTLCEGEEILK